MAANCHRLWNGSLTSFPAISGWHAEVAIVAAGRKTDGGEDRRPSLIVWNELADKPARPDLPRLLSDLQPPVRPGPNELRSTFSPIRPLASHRHLSHHRVAILLRGARPLDEITDHRTHHRRCAFLHPGVRLLRLSIVSRAIRRGQLGASVTDATL